VEKLFFNGTFGDHPSPPNEYAKKVEDPLNIP
jgi:hypothetical protein